MNGKQAALGLGVVQENRGNQGFVIGETEKLLVGDIRGEAGGLQEVGGSEVLALGDVYAENGVVESALRIRRREKAKYAENAVVVQTADAVPGQKVAQERRHRVVLVVQEHEVGDHARYDVLLLNVHVADRDEVLYHIVD